MDKKLFIISGCNGAGKTTAAATLLPTMFERSVFVNADNIARRLNPEKPESVAIEAGKVMLQRIDELISQGKSLTIETTLSTRSYKNLIQRAKAKGYRVRLLYFWLNSPQLAIERVATRVMEGGHNIPPDVITRRYWKGILNLFQLFIPLSDFWSIHDNSTNPRQNVAYGFTDKITIIKEKNTFNQLKQYNFKPNYYETDYSKYEQYSELLEKALELSEQLMLNEKAAKGENVVVSIKGKIVKIPAQDILKGWNSAMDLLGLPLWKSSSTSDSSTDSDITPA